MRAAGNVSSAQRDAERGLAALFPALGPWGHAALAVGIAPAGAGVPTGQLTAELERLHQERLGPFVAQLLDQLPAASVEPAVRTAVQQSAFMALAQSHAVTAQAVGVVTSLAADGLSPVVIKGPAVARHYGLRTLRSFGDIDVLVTPNRFPATLQRLLAEGWLENDTSRQPWPYFHRWCRESVNLSKPGAGSIDLHHRASPWIWSSELPAADLVSRASSEVVGGVDLPCTDLADSVLISALQLITDHEAPGSKLIAWRDIAELARVEPETVAARANTAALGGVLRALMSAMPDALRPRECEQLLDREIAHPRRLVTLLRSAARGAYVRNHMARLPIMNAVAYSAGTLVPSAAFLRETYPDVSHRRRAWWRDIAEGMHASAPTTGSGS